ncbi:MAG: DUF1659 domain-containing protein [Romboutsia sp.]|uniref:DUF1659 domain-containing protein n=1 Tax=Romboutsia sp. TaxID=1965302 RepID=UPI003F3D4D55
MAVTEIKNPSSLRLTYDFGKDPETQKAIRKNKTYASVKPTAAAQDIYEVGAMISSLQDGSLIQIAKLDNTTIAE